MTWETVNGNDVITLNNIHTLIKTTDVYFKGLDTYADMVLVDGTKLNSDLLECGRDEYAKMTEEKLRKHCTTLQEWQYGYATYLAEAFCLGEVMCHLEHNEVLHTKIHKE